MWYSPKNKIKAFIENKEEEIKDIENKTRVPKITCEEIERNRRKLEQLRSTQNQLERKDHRELREVVNSSQSAVNDLGRKQKVAAESLEQHRSQLREMDELGAELCAKRLKIENIIKETQVQREKIINKKQNNNAQILDLEEQLTCRRKELAKERALRDQLSTDHHEIKSKASRAELQLTQIGQQNTKLRQLIRHQLEAIAKLQYNISKEELQTENSELRIENKELRTQSLHSRIEVSQAQLQRLAEDKLMLINETETAQNIEGLIELCTQNHRTKWQEREQCEKQISQIRRQIQEGQCERQILIKMLNTKRDNLQELREKGTELKCILNSVFQQDSNVIKLIAEKKVYDEPIPAKGDALDAIETSDNFFLPNEH